MFFFFKFSLLFIIQDISLIFLYVVCITAYGVKSKYSYMYDEHPLGPISSIFTDGIYNFEKLHN